ncbi:MAG: IS4 family transposase, partial [Nannocystaceae bacterium]
MAFTSDPDMEGRRLVQVLTRKYLVPVTAIPHHRHVTVRSQSAALHNAGDTPIAGLLRGVDQRFDARFQDDSRWRGRRVLAVDGSHVTLQRSPELFRAFRCAQGAHNPQARVSVLIDVVSKVPIDVAVAPYQASERHILTEQRLQHVRPGDVVVLDRGYPGSNEMASLLAAGVDFVVRVSVSGTFAAVEEFAQCDRAADRELVIDPSQVAANREPIRVRAVRSARPNNEDTILLTTLRDVDGFSRTDIEQLYRMRWESEEHYNRLKSDYMAQGQLHARTALGVHQEIAAIMVFHGLSQLVLAAAAAESSWPFLELS